MFKHFDIHSHLNLSPLKEQQDEIIKTLEDQQIATIVVGVDKESSQEAVLIANKSQNLFASIGLHPSDSKEEFDQNFYEEIITNPKVVCIGECGLDYFRLEENPEVEIEKQKLIFKKQIELSLKAGKPLMIHARPTKGSMNAYSDVLDILGEYKKKNQNLNANFHFFVGDLEIAKRVLELGFTMSFDGPITFTSDYDEVIKYIPLESIMSETDAPFASPVPYRGQTNYPYYVSEVVKRISKIKDLPIEVVEKQLVENALRFFRI